MNSLLDMYAKCGCMDDGFQVFSRFHDKDVVTWTTIISGYARQGLDDKAFQLLEEMRREGVNPDKFAFMCVLKACASVKSLEKGRLIHVYVVQSGLELDAFMVSTLVDFYSKCGHLTDARHAFDSIIDHDVVSWTAMLVAYAKHGCGQEALELMGKMLDSGVKLNHVTLLGVLSACSHSGMLEEGQYMFDIMKQKSMVTKTAEHYACMIDLLTRAGCLEAAEQLLTDLPFEPNVSMWLALLRSCIICGNRDLAKHAAEHVLKLEPGNEVAFVLLSNVCANGASGIACDVMQDDDWLSVNQLQVG
ncbi:hypothetical protein GOP47_0006705 [Adiantum capillus-veneris]|uniref:Pentatricopeptide repeat-containing protein n=1 Tax=Adiantum capillus-veneris TaxID=13818 RepID=A0A9D4V3D8_ADICA|nr:hypothetical protein GOP47_0006705 [Adiantum capillus-veneris]